MSAKFCTTQSDGILPQLKQIRIVEGRPERLIARIGSGKSSRSEEFLNERFKKVFFLL